MELLLDPGAGGTLRGLRDEESGVGAVHLPEGVTPPATGDTENAEAAGEFVEPAARAAMEALLARRRQLEARMIRPARGRGRPR